MRLARSLILVVLTLGLSVTSARASSIVYDNGPINGTITSWNISTFFSQTDSFSVASATTLDSATIGVWVLSGGAPVDVAWSIGTAAFGADVASGNSTFSNTFLFTSNAVGQPYDIYSSVFAVSGTVAPGTTYWLTLGHATTTVTQVHQDASAYWDENDGPSTAFSSFSLTQNPSEAFALSGSPADSAPVPEPASLTLLGLGLAGMGAKRWRQRKA